MQVLHCGKYLEFDIKGSSLYIEVRVSHEVQHAHVRLQLCKPIQWTEWPTDAIR
jgi:hypothetical protein